MLSLYYGDIVSCFNALVYVDKILFEYCDLMRFLQTYAAFSLNYNITSSLMDRQQDIFCVLCPCVKSNYFCSVM